MTRRRLALFGSSTADDGGSELRLLHMARYFHDRSDVTLFLPDQGPLYRLAREAGIDAVSLDFLRMRRYRGLDWIRWYGSYRSAASRFRKELQSRRIELVHFNDIIDLPFYPVARKAGVPIVGHLRFILGSGWGRRLYRAWVHRSGAFIVPVSDAVRIAMLGESTRIPHRRVYNPRPNPTLFFPRQSDAESRWKSVREQLGWGPETLAVGMVSKLLENKGHLAFIDAAQKLHGLAPAYRFLMIAGPSPGREAYEAQVSRAVADFPPGVFTWIRGVPNPELPAYLRACDALAHIPDVEDSFPGVVLESMACGVPVVGYRVGGVGEQLDGGRCGVLVNRGDVEGVVRAIEKLCTDSGYRRDLAEKALHRLDTEFSEQAHFSAIKQIHAERIGD